MIRRPAVAGMFYEDAQDALVRSLEECFLSELGPGSLPTAPDVRSGRVLGLVSPHAGYVYSGPAAAWAYHALAADGAPDVAVILGPNHHGLGAGVAVSAASEWETPLGASQVDRETADAIVRASEYAEFDDTAHLREHSIEVQIPFLQFACGQDVKIVPIAIGYVQASEALPLVRDLSQAVAGALAGKSAVVIASTDLSHYESQAVAEKMDSLAIGRIEALDPEGLLRVVEENSISMCGHMGTAVMLAACKAMGSTKARKLTYHTSGDVTGDATQVVGYGALSVER